MSKRSYNQYCPIAYSLDLLGERWTLLIVRELMYGPRRFTDLGRGLPGISRNLLSHRLKDLEGAGVIQQRTLPPPTPAVVYQLTEYGTGLSCILGDLTRWGLTFLEEAPLQDDHLGAVSMINVLNALFVREKAAGLEMAAELHLGEEVFRAQIRGGELVLAQGASQDARLSVHTDTKTLIRLVMGAFPAQEAVQEGLVEIEKGNLRNLTQFVELFRPPVTG